MSGDGKFKWYWGRGEEPEYMSGPEDSREAILQVARLESDGAGFTICEADKVVPGFDFFDADNVLEQYEEHNCDCWSEDGADIEASREAKRELEKVLSATFKRWAKKHDALGYAWAFGTTRHSEYFPATKAEGQS